MDYTECFKEVVSQYSFIDPQVEFIRHNENVTYKVTEKGSEYTYLLRIHQPISKNMQGLQNTRKAIQSELDFILAWSSHSKQPVQLPVPNRDGKLVTSIFFSGETMHSSVLKWITGEQTTKNDFNNKETVLMLGEQISCLHEFSRGLALSPGFVRPEYGIEWINTMQSQLQSGNEKGVILPEEFHIFENVFAAARDHMNGISKTIETWGFTHADIHNSNLIRTSKGISFIDFGLSGFGYYSMDLALAALFIPKELRNELLSGYNRVYLKKVGIDQLELFSLLSIIGYYAFIVSREDKHRWIRDHIRNLFEHVCRPYLKGESFFYTI